MAIAQGKKSQLACKIINVRKIKASMRKIGRHEQPAPAEIVDQSSQLKKVRSWGARHSKAQYLEERLRLHRREAEILEGLFHVNIIALLMTSGRLAD